MKIIPLILGVVVVFLSSIGHAVAFDHAHTAWDAILNRYVVKQGAETRVRYADLKGNVSDLEDYLADLSSVSVEEYQEFTPDQRLAFLINSYNAFTVKLVVDNYPIGSIKDLGNVIFSPWRKKFFYLLGEQRSLDDIEHQQIRRQFDEPRIHFAVNCASISCPALQKTAYRAEELDRQLQQAAVDFIGNEMENSYEAESKVLRLSRIFKWYGSDFDNRFGSHLKFIASLITDDPMAQNLIAEGQVRVRYQNYDWGLNDEGR